MHLFSRKYSYLLGSCNFKYCYVFCVDLPLMMKTVSSRPKFVESSNCHVTKSGCYVLSFFILHVIRPNKSYVRSSFTSAYNADNEVSSYRGSFHINILVLQRERRASFVIPRTSLEVHYIN